MAVNNPIIDNEGVLLRGEGLISPNGQSLRFAGQRLILQAFSNGEASDIFTVFGLNPTNNAPTTLMQLQKNGTLIVNGVTQNVITTQGDIIVGNASGNPARLAIGANGTFLTSNGTTASWSNTIAAGGLIITAGGLTVSASGATITDSANPITANNSTAGAGVLSMVRIQRNTVVKGYIGTDANDNLALIDANGSVARLSVSTSGVAITGTASISSIGAFASGDKYLIVDSSGNIHKSATGPAS